ncbi:MAG: hypothetical protein PVSMB1_04100 [Gemmatimonadaceae bacterium]
MEAESAQHVIGDEIAFAGSREKPARTSIVRDCVIAALAVLLALGAQVVLRPALGHASPFLLFTPAVAIGAFYGGIASGILATALSTVLGSRFLLSGTGAPSIEQWDRVCLFILVGGVITASSTMLRRSSRRLSESLWREQKARAIAEAADRTKDDFLAMVSHELQTPVSVVLGWISSIRQGRFTPAALENALDAVERNARVASRLVDDVLDRSRIATGTLRLDPQVISLGTVVRAAVDQARGRLEASGLHLDVVTPAEEPLVLADSIRLQQVLTNLLSNAIKFTPRGGRVTVTISSTDSVASVTVLDTGTGIAPEFLPHVFESLRQGHDTLHQSPQGLGLGLSIARYLVERQNGTIHAASEGAGRGSVFTIALPLAQPRDARSDTRDTAPAALQAPTALIH